MVGFVATLAKYLGSGPYWYTITMGTQGCRENWWKNMLYSTFDLFDNIFVGYVIFNAIFCVRSIVNNLFPVNLNSVVSFYFKHSF